MRVSSINNSNNTNFQMLKIDKKSVIPLLEKESPELVKRLDELGKDIINIRRFDVVLKDSLVPKVYAAGAKLPEKKPLDYLADFKENVEPYLGKHYIHTNGDETIQGIYPEVPRLFIEVLGEDAAKEFERYKKLDIYGQAGLLSRILNQHAYNLETRALNAQIEAKKQQEMKELLKQAHKEEITKLMDIYGEDMACAVPQKPSKKSFFNRILEKLIK